MPVQSEFEELASNCDWEWCEIEGISGMKVTGHNGNSIFLPAGASRTGEAISNQIGQRGCYWSGTLWDNNTNFASYLYFYSDADNVQPVRSNRRYMGMSVRAVANNNNSGIMNIETADNDFSISLYGRTIVLNGIDDKSKVDVYDLMGNLLYNGTRHQIEMNGNGLYLVKVNTRTKKIRI